MAVVDGVGIGEIIQRPASRHHSFKVGDIVIKDGNAEKTYTITSINGMFIRVDGETSGSLYQRFTLADVYSGSAIKVEKRKFYNIVTMYADEHGNMVPIVDVDGQLCLHYSNTNSLVPLPKDIFDEFIEFRRKSEHFDGRLFE